MADGDAGNSGIKNSGPMNKEMRDDALTMEQLDRVAGGLSRVTPPDLAKPHEPLRVHDVKADPLQR